MGLGHYTFRSRCLLAEHIRHGDAACALHPWHQHRACLPYPRGALLLQRQPRAHCRVLAARGFCTAPSPRKVCSRCQTVWYCDDPRQPNLNKTNQFEHKYNKTCRKPISLKKNLPKAYKNKHFQSPGAPNIMKINSCEPESSQHYTNQAFGAPEALAPNGHQAQTNRKPTGNQS